ncbi:DUF2514 domain-containing protein [Diaphorobacter caeni]|uniref:DUF2514 domain-containing protein n=1 Tax=Diaphorobacter caeni TaxID=2784387 RepID=UPI00188E50CB|nr:DUF2514 domain-containing protein [Diaphorobacter caeni]MBF5006389.1 DUF2514 domain-containing protein [Diaphorobacter caeni]
MSYRVIAILVLIIGALVGVKALESHLIAKGDARGAARIQTRWDTAEAKRRGDEKEAEARLQNERAQAESNARIAEQRKQQEAERIAREQAEREASLRASLRSAESRNRGLLDTINELNARDRARAAAHVPGTSPDASAVAIVDEAAAARTLLGQCSDRRTALAADADGLRLQVIGLQAYVTDVCLARKVGE